MSLPQAAAAKASAKVEPAALSKRFDTSEDTIPVSALQDSDVSCQRHPAPKARDPNASVSTHTFLRKHTGDGGAAVPGVHVYYGERGNESEQTCREGLDHQGDLGEKTTDIADLELVTSDVVTTDIAELAGSSAWEEPESTHPAKTER